MITNDEYKALKNKAFESDTSKVLDWIEYKFKERLSKDDEIPIYIFNHNVDFKRYRKSIKKFFKANGWRVDVEHDYLRIVPKDYIDWILIIPCTPFIIFLITILLKGLKLI